MTRGGKRKGAGRKKSGKQTAFFWLTTETLDLLSEMVPDEERSAFVDKLIQNRLNRMRKK